MYLNLGCGPGRQAADSYVHIDSSRKLILKKFFVPLNFVLKRKANNADWDTSVKFKNVLNLRYEFGQVKGVYSSHLLEHLYRADALKLIQDVYNFLQPGGLFRLALPDYHQFILEYLENFKDDPILAINCFESQLLTNGSERLTYFNLIRKNLLGDLHTHKWHPTLPLLQQDLLNVGFSTVHQMDFRVSGLPQIELLENRQSQTFFLEARK